MHDLAVHGETFHLAMGIVQNAATRGLVHTATLHAHEAVLYHIHTTDAVLATDLVEGPHDLKRVKLLAVDRDAISLHVVEGDELRLVRRVFRHHR